MGGSMEHIEPGMEGRGNELYITGSELVADVSMPPPFSGVASSVPRGGVLAMLPLNPLACDGMRVSKMLEQFDQFHVDSIIYEYVPFCNATVGGGLVMAIVNDVDDPVTFEGGFAALRDLTTRTGAVEFNVYAHAACQTGTPLMQWYYTGRNQDADLTQPGMLIIMAGTDLAAPTVTIPLGIVWMHYRLRVRAPSIERPLSQIYFTQASNLTFTTFAGGLGALLAMQWAATSLPIVFQKWGLIGWATIVSADDAAYGSSAWRGFINQQIGLGYAHGPGTVIFWRTWDVAGTITFYFYDTFSDAVADVQGLGGLMNPVAASAVVRGFKLWNVMGTDAINA
jgi:hypothetical protein